MAIIVPAKRRWWSRARAGDTAPTTGEAGAVAAARTVDVVDAAVVARSVVAACAFGAAAIHFGLAPEHFDESRFHGTFFFLAGWAQVVFGLAVVQRPSRALLRAGILLNVGIVLVWAMSRVVGMPLGDNPWVGEPVGFPDAMATVLEVAAVVGSYLLLIGRFAAKSVGRSVAMIGATVAAFALVGGTTASVAPGLAGDARGHVHGASAVGHTHGGSGSLTGATSSATGAGASGRGHTHGVAAGIESGNGTSPCEESGVTVDGNSAGHGERGPVAQQAITQPATRELLAAQLTTARDAALQLPTAGDAVAAGYRKVTNYIPCIAAHYINLRYVDRTFDPAHPEMLLYDGNGPDARIVGLSYFVTGTSVAPEGFAGPNDPWHQHIGLCIGLNGLVIGGSNLSAPDCLARGGIKVDGSRSWMVHAWVVPGWESAWGTFSGENPELGRSVAH